MRQVSESQIVLHFSGKQRQTLAVYQRVCTFPKHCDTHAQNLLRLDLPVLRRQLSLLQVVTVEVTGDYIRSATAEHQDCEAVFVGALQLIVVVSSTTDMVYFPC